MKSDKSPTLADALGVLAALCREHERVKASLADARRILGDVRRYAQHGLDKLEGKEVAARRALGDVVCEAGAALARTA